MANPAPALDDPEPAAEGKAATPASSSMLATIAAFLILTVIGAAAGGGFGWLVGTRNGAVSVLPSKTEAASQAGTSRYPANVGVRALNPIITSVTEPEHAWVRLEASLVMEHEQSAEAVLLAGAISEDIIAFLRTLSLRQIEGASGFQHLREDLKDRARLRSDGKVRDLIIQALVVE